MSGLHSRKHPQTSAPPPGQNGQPAGLILAELPRVRASWHLDIQGPGHFSLYQRSKVTPKVHSRNRRVSVLANVSRLRHTGRLQALDPEPAQGSNVLLPAGNDRP